jgi:glucokinase
MLALAGKAEALHAGHVAQAAKHGDQVAAAIWDAAMEELAIGLGNAISTLAPDRLVIGGGVAQAGEQLLAPLRAGLARRVKLVPIERLDIRLAALGSTAGLHGAAVLAAGVQAPLS